MSAPYSPANASSLTNILRRYADWLDKQEPDCNVAHAEAVNAFLDELLRGNAFGTEGQCDPRGDHRG